VARWRVGEVLNFDRLIFRPARYPVPRQASREHAVRQRTKKPPPALDQRWLLCFIDQALGPEPELLVELGDTAGLTIAPRWIVAADAPLSLGRFPLTSRLLPIPCAIAGAIVSETIAKANFTVTGAGSNA
jgi:hypothetical protein